LNLSVLTKNKYTLIILSGNRDTLSLLCYKMTHDVILVILLTSTSTEESHDSFRWTVSFNARI